MLIYCGHLSPNKLSFRRQDQYYEKLCYHFIITAGAIFTTTPQIKSTGSVYHYKLDKITN